MQKVTMNQPATNQHGALLITTALVETGIHFYVSDGVQRVDELTKTFADRTRAAAFYRHVAAAAEQGKRIYQIVWEVQALEEAQNAATGRTPDEVAEAINGDADGYLAAETAEHNRVVNLVAEATGAGDGWYAARRQARQAATLTQASKPRDFSKGRIGCKPLTAVELDLIRSQRDGVITTRPGQSWTVLRAIWRRIGGQPTYRPGTRIIASLRLTAAGREFADQQNGVAA